MKALLIVDMQVGCFVGPPPRWDADGVISRINILSQAIRKQGMVIFIQHTDILEGLEYGSDSWQLLNSLTRSPDDAVVEKSACDSFLETNLDSLLKDRSVTDLIITGSATDFCVDTTIRSAAARGYKISVPSDAHTTRDRPHLHAEKIIEHHNYMWSELLLPRQAKVRVVPTDMLLAEIQNV